MGPRKLLFPFVLWNSEAHLSTPNHFIKNSICRGCAPVFSCLVSEARRNFHNSIIVKKMAAIVNSLDFFFCSDDARWVFRPYLWLCSGMRVGNHMRCQESNWPVTGMATPLPTVLYLWLLLVLLYILKLVKYLWSYPSPTFPLNRTLQAKQYLAQSLEPDQFWVLCVIAGLRI